MPVTNPGFQGVPEALPDEVKHRQMIARLLNSVLQGKVNAYYDLTLTAGATTTTLNDPRIGFYSIVCPAMPMTASSAADIGTIYVTGLMKGTCTIHHRNNAATDRTIRFLIVG